jgi:hypothetical protein
MENIQTSSVESPSVEDDSRSSSQEIPPPPFKWNPKVHHRVYNSALLDPILSQLNPSHPNLLGSVLLLSFNLRLGLPRFGLFTSCS